MDNKNTNININITSESIVRLIFFVSLFALGFYLKDLMLTILTSIVVASALEPFILWFKERKLPRVMAVIVIYVALFVTIFILISIFLPLIFDDIFKLFSSIPSMIKSFDIFNYISDVPAQILNTLKNMVADSFSLDKLIPGIKGLMSGTSDSLADTAKFIFGNIFSFGFIIVFSFYLAVQEAGIEAFLQLVTPLKYEDYIINLWKRSSKKIGLWLQGQILLGVLIGVFVFLGLSILGIKNALALGVFASIFEIIPVFGPILAAVPAVILAFIQSPTLGLFVLGFFIIIQQFENHLIYPLVVRKMIGIPPLLSIVFLVVGAQLAGFLGVVLAVPVAVILMEIIEDFEKKKRFVSQPTK